MKTWTNDHDTVVADDLVEVRSILERLAGCPVGFEPSEWEECDEGESLTIWCNADGHPGEPHAPGNSKVTKTIGEWARQEGQGFLCSTEY